MLPAMALLSLALFAALAPLAVSQQKGVSVSLKARWNGTSYLAEAAEFLVRR